ncbi:hypothetical protein EWT20_20895 [Escherichia coli O25b:H4]|nr:hypothetical protein EWT20_20895 [Escherichia coli O25b:H4]
MVQKILSDKVMNERTNAYYSYYLGERNISVLPLNVYDPPERFIAYIKKNRENLNITRKRKLTAVCSHQTRIGNLDAHLI